MLRDTRFARFVTSSETDDQPGDFIGSAGRGSVYRGRAHRGLVLCALAAWLSGCASRDRDAGAAYWKARSALRTGDFSQSLETAREGLRRWPDGDWGWRFRLVCAEDLMILSRVKEARALLETAGSPSEASLQARLTMDRARVALSLDTEKGSKLMHEALQAALASRDTARRVAG